MALIQYGDLCQIEPIRQDRTNGVAEQSVLQANKWAKRRAITYKVWLGFRNKLKNHAQRLSTTLSLPSKTFWTAVWKIR